MRYIPKHLKAYPAISKVLFTILACCLYLYPAHADTIRLKNGNKLEGIVLETYEDTIIVKLDIGTMTFSLDEIAEIKKSSNQEKKELEKRWKKEKKTTQGMPSGVKIVKKEAQRHKPEKRSAGIPSEIDWVYSYDNGTADAAGAGKPAMIDFYTDWCGWCKKLDRDTYTDKEVLALSIHFVCIKVDADRNRPLIKRYNINGYPTIVFLSPSGNEIGRIIGYLPPKRFAQRMKAYVK